MLWFNLFNEFPNPAEEKDPADIHFDSGGIHGDHYSSVRNKRANAHLSISCSPYAVTNIAFIVHKKQRSVK